MISNISVALITITLILFRATRALKTESTIAGILTFKFFLRYFIHNIKALLKNLK